LLAVSNGGHFFGSVSGGCVEEDLISRLAKHPAKQATLLLYGETQEQRHHFGLPCGGVLQLVAEPFNDINEIKNLIHKIENREAVYRTTFFSDDAKDLQHTVSSTEFSAKHKIALSEKSWSNIFGPVWHLIIVGAGETGQYLVQFANSLGFQVSITDPRPDYRANWPLDNFPLLHGFPDDAIESIHVDKRTAIVTVAHDPRVDDMALLQALKSDAFYVGALGSKANNDQRRERLIEHFDFSQKQVARLHGPVGVPIGSITPAEIALAVMAEITALKNGVNLKAQLDQSAYASTSQSEKAACQIAS
jgi:xanthine dehydrogenase accessory factor